MDSSVRIVRAGIEDALSARALVREAYAKWVPIIGREPLPMGVDYATAIRDHDIDLLLAGDRLAGLIETIVAVDHVFIENVAVAPAYQGRGFGRRLLDHAERTARDGGFGQMRLLTNGAFDTNVKLYLRLGYGIDRDEPFLGGTTVHMSKMLYRDP